MKPSEEPQIKKEKIAIRDLLVDPIEPVQEKVFVPAEESEKVEASTAKSEEDSSALDAHFVRDTIVDGSKICAGYQFVQAWTLRNPGPNAWPAGCSVRHVGGDNMLNVDNTGPLSHTDLAEASESNVLSRPVQAGEEISFRVIMKAPARMGTAISYWRLKTADGTPFGHRLWCDINVVAPTSPSPAQLAPEPVSAPEPIPAATSPLYGHSPLYERLLQSRLERMKTAMQTHQQQFEQQKMERIQRLRKAAVERLMENRRREHEAALATIKQEPVEEVAPEPTAELPVEEKPVERSPKLQASRSHMIFPQLDKESPESSTYESSTTVQAESPKSEKSTLARTVTVASDDEFFEDAESVALHSDDEGFMTDEEYDILDASDEEMV